MRAIMLSLFPRYVMTMVRVLQCVLIVVLQDNVSDVHSQKANNAAVSQLTSHSSPQVSPQVKL